MAIEEQKISDVAIKEIKSLLDIRPKASGNAMELHQDITYQILLRLADVKDPAFAAGVVFWFVQRYTEVDDAFVPVYLHAISNMYAAGIPMINVERDLRDSVNYVQNNLNAAAQGRAMPRLAVLNELLAGKPVTGLRSGPNRNAWIDLLMQIGPKPKANGEVSGEIKLIAAWLRGDAPRDVEQVQDVFEWFFLGSFSGHNESNYFGALRWIVEDSGIQGIDVYAELDRLMDTLSSAQKAAHANQVEAINNWLAHRPYVAPVIPRDPVMDAKMATDWKPKINNHGTALEQHRIYVNEFVAWFATPRNPAQAAQALQFLAERFTHAPSKYSSIYLQGLESLLLSMTPGLEVRAVLQQYVDQVNIDNLPTETVTRLPCGNWRT